MRTLFAICAITISASCVDERSEPGDQGGIVTPQEPTTTSATAGVGNSHIVWRDRLGNIVPVVAADFGDIVTLPKFYVADANGIVWYFDQLRGGTPGWGKVMSRYYTTRDCSGEVYVGPIPSRLAVFVAGAPGNGNPVYFKDDAALVAISPQSYYAAGSSVCMDPNMNVSYLHKLANAIPVQIPTRVLYQPPLHPEVAF
ncbi:hypothetical protein LVJ94_17215 [Pendulispora rubella]|uniref:Uncharacterized protein n=1 Tax=Pendulispora rubella TaxID=2741070 RepID=A0ABZ2LDE9_9BACT